MTEPLPASPDSGDPFRYSYAIDPDSDTTAARVVRRVGLNKRVLELGCAAGHMSAVLAARGCQVVGVELDPTLAAQAAQVCERVIVGDLDGLDLAAELGDEGFDVVLAADVLEHLREPGRLLGRLRPFLRPNGYLVVSLPNVAHGSVRLALLGGHFPYQDLGLLDRTHLRFYTLASLERLLAEADFAIAHLDRVLGGVAGAEVPWDRAAAPDSVVQALEQDTEATTYQFIVVAFPLPDPDAPSLRDWLNRVAVERDRAEAEVRDRVTRLGEANAGLTAQVADLTSHRDALAAELEAARGRLAEQAAHLATLQEQLELHLDYTAQMRDLLLTARDRVVRLEARQAELSEALRRTAEEVRWMRASKSWQWIERLWALRRWLRRG